MEHIMIGIAGGSGSGKSTFTNRLKEAYENDICVIYHDNYYKRRDDISFEERKFINYDSPDAFDTELLIRDLERIKAGEAIECPVYDYSQHNRSSDIIHIEPKKVIIVEGILVLYEHRLRDLFDIKIFVDADADERILRRVIRDVKERGRDVEGIAFQYLQTVKPMHYAYVQPTMAMADIIINSGMNDVAFDIISAKIRELI